VEPIIIYAYTYGNDDRSVEWTPLMVKLRDVFYRDDYEIPITPEKKAEVLSALPCSSGKEASVEFLYLNGDKRGWTWGKNGMTNAAFIFGGAREYFRNFF
jgi:hypothetical protein